MMKKIIITISLSMLIITGVFGIGIENVFATVCNQTVEVEDKNESFIYIEGVTIVARPNMGIIIKCTTNISGECVLEGLLEHTSYTIIVEQNSIPAEYECEYISADCETEIIACVSKQTFELKKIVVSEPELESAPVFQVNNLVDLTSEGSDRNNDCVNDCQKVRCKSDCGSAGTCNCRTVGEGEGATTVCDPNYKCSGCSGPDPCPMDRTNGINDVFGSLDGHYQNVEDDYNKILKSFERIRDIDAPSIKDSYKKINSIIPIDLFAINKKGDTPSSQGEYFVDPQNEEIFEDLNYCRSKMNLCFSRLHEYEVIEKEEVVREILIPCQIGKYEYLTGAENCYGFDMEHLDRAENLLCYHHIGEISLDELAEEEPELEPELEEPEEADVILGQIWLDIHKYTYETWCRDKNKKNPSNIGYVKDPNKCCKKHYENSVETELIDTVRHPDANHYWEKYNCLGY
jgi:hypothetical protein